MSLKKSKLTIINWMFIAFAITLLIFSRVPSKNDLYGVWKGNHLGKEVIFEFNSDGTCVLNFKENLTGVNEKMHGNFEINFTQNPIPLSIRNIAELDHPLHTIVEFVGMDVIRIAKFAPGWKIRPISFNSYSSIKMKRTNKIN